MSCNNLITAFCLNLSKQTGLNQAASGMASQSLCEAPEEEQRESCPFDKLATRLGLPTNCDIDLRKQEELEVIVNMSLSDIFSSIISFPQTFGV